MSTQSTHALVPAPSPTLQVSLLQPKGIFLQPPSIQMLFLFTPIPLVPQPIFTPYFLSHNRKLHLLFSYHPCLSLKASGNFQSWNVSTFQPQECLNNGIRWIPFKPSGRRNDKGIYHARRERQKGCGCQ